VIAGLQLPVQFPKQLAASHCRFDPRGIVILKVEAFVFQFRLVTIQDREKVSGHRTRHLAKSSFDRAGFSASVFALRIRRRHLFVVPDTGQYGIAHFVVVRPSVLTGD
jgi:hypothetical protein